MYLLVRSVIIIVLLGLSACSGQSAENYKGNDQSTVLARKNQDASILKQIHSHNDDGSYTYGYEGSDGSFKIETKSVTGEVSGKYGYVDDSGKLRVVEYGANAYGFQPSGEGITVPSPTLDELPRERVDGEYAEPQLPVKRPVSAKQQFRSGPENDAFVQRQQPNGLWSPAADFDGYDDAAVRVGSARPRTSSTRTKSVELPPPPPAPVLDSFRPAPELLRQAPPPPPPPPSGWSIQEFGGGRGDASYRTYEDRELYETGLPAAPYRPAVTATSPMRNNYRTAPRRSQTGSVLDQLTEQYALPNTGSPVSHFSFGTDTAQII